MSSFDPIMTAPPSDDGVHGFPESTASPSGHGDRLAVEVPGLLVAECRPDGLFRFATAALLDTLGYTAEEFTRRHYADTVFGEEYGAAGRESLWARVLAGEPVCGRLRLVGKHGVNVWLEGSHGLVRGSHGAPGGVILCGIDVSTKHRRQVDCEGRLRAITNTLPVVEFDMSGHIIGANEPFLRQMGYGFEEIVGRHQSLLLTAEDAAGAEHARVWQRLRRGEPSSGRFKRIARSGAAVWVAASVQPIMGEDGAPFKVVEYALDVTDRAAGDPAPPPAAGADELTGLSNRAEFVRRLTAALAQTAEHRSHHCAVLFLDLDRFKLINDTLGHEAGNSLLCAFADRLRSALRVGDAGTDRPYGNVLARFGGDEFAVLLANLRDADHAVAVARRLLEAAARPYLIDGREVHTSASAGIVTSRGVGDGAETLIRNADVAMFEAKRGGKRRCVLFNEAMQVRLTRELAVESALRGALDARQLHLVYQPIVDLDSRRVVSVEALLRWTHPELGVISPSEFIPIAEDSGLIIPIGQWVLEQACRQFMIWREAAPERAPQTISVNVARAQLALGGALVEQIRSVMERCRMPPGSLTLEITEREVVRDPELSLRLLEAIHHLGVKLAMDDFGTGASSLGCLRAYPFDTIKIDRTFLGGLEGDRDVLAVLHATVTLIQNLGKASVAEGIENPTQLAILQSLGCRLGQGYLLGRPADALALSW